MHNFAVEVLNKDVKESSLLDVLLITAMLIEHKHQITYSEKEDVIVFLHQVAERCNLPKDLLNRGTLKRAQLNVSPIDLKNGVDLALLVAHLHIYLLNELHVLPFNVAHTMVDALNKRGMLSDQSDQLVCISQVACIHDHTAVAAVLAMIGNYQVECHFQNELLIAIFAWLELAFNGKLTLKEFSGLDSLSKHDAIIMALPFGNSAYEDADLYEVLRTKSDFIVAYHAMKFYLRAGSYERSRQRVFFAPIGEGGFNTSISALILTPSIGHSLLTGQLMVVDFAHPSDGIKMLDLSKTTRKVTERLIISNWINILFDASQTNVRHVSSVEIARNSFNLSVTAYVIKAELAKWIQQINTSNIYELWDLVEFDRTLAFRAWEDHADAVSFYELAISDIDDFGNIAEPTRVRNVSQKDAPLLQKQCLKAGDILISTKGTLGKVVMMQDIIPTNWFVSPSFIVFRVKEREANKGLNAAYLYQYLNSTKVQEYLQLLNTGGTVPMIRLEDIKKIPVVLGSQDLYSLAEKQMLNKHQMIEQIDSIKMALDGLSKSFMQQLNKHSGIEFN
jgi:hypothetical protein